MIPIRDHNPSGRTPYVTYSLIGLNVAVFVYMFFLGETGLRQFIEQYAMIPAKIIAGQSLLTMLTAMFLHGGLAHIIGNMLFLNIFGDNLEDRFGHVRYFGFYLLAGLAGSALQVAINPSSTIPNLGASGAIAGVMGGYLVLFPRERIDVLWTFGFLGVSTVPASAMLFYWILFQFIAGAGSFASQGGGVAYFAHIGGFAFGYLVTRLFVKAKPTIARWV
ncbi:MAG: rhomboid family intramembrane serine protease [Candidatus Kerfeldbacteria bacterium]|nr:rhomboid family intramembrane serine protease [Candidatus Kerfeldbacteria bacterium]